MAKAVLLGQYLATKLTEAGLVPKDASRIIIDIPVNEAVKIHYETFCDRKLLDMGLPELLAKHFEVAELNQVNQK